MRHQLFLSFFLLLSLPAFADNGSAFAGPGLKAEYTGEAPAKVSTEMPAELKDVGIQEKLGDKIDLGLVVTDEKGEKQPLSAFFHSNKPVIMSPVYFSCPGLCNFHLNGLTDTLKQLDWSPGSQFEIVAFSFDPKETSEVAMKKKQNYLKEYARVGTDNGWHFVTADAETIKKFTGSVGFKYRWNEQVGEWSHASAAIVVSPEGKISRYLHGIMFEPRDLKLALNEASQGKTGNIVDSVMLYCFKYDSHRSKYGLQVFNLMKLGGALTVLALALWLVPVMIRARRENT